LPRYFCQGCFEKQIEIDRLKEEVHRLKARLRYQQRTAGEGFFGSSTPSSKIPVKPNTPEEQQRKRGGARHGHPGHGRQAVEESEADSVVDIDIGDRCPECGGGLKESKGFRSRTVIDIQPIKVKKTVYHIWRRRCTQCGRVFQGKIPGVLPKSLFGNELLSHIVLQHYIYGTPLGRLEAQLGIGIGSMIGALHRLGRLFRDIPEKLILEYRESPVKHADETGWRNDGRSGYSWLFCTEKTSIFRFRNTRSSKVPLEVLGTKHLPGVLVVDRYNAYNKAPVSLQYCYAHLLREVEDLEKEFPEDTEVNCFVSTFAPLLTQAMRLRSQDISDKRFYQETLILKKKMLRVVRKPAKHPGIQRIQDIFRDNAHRMYHWVKNRDVPAENNLVERELRPTVIARKVSFGSQSDEGAKTREILMTVLHTLKKRTPDFAAQFKSALDKLAADPGFDSYQSLFPPPDT
jgi:transposase